MTSEKAFARLGPPDWARQIGAQLAPDWEVRQNGKVRQIDPARTAPERITASQVSQCPWGGQARPAIASHGGHDLIFSPMLLTKDGHGYLIGLRPHAADLRKIFFSFFFDFFLTLFDHIWPCWTVFGARKKIGQK